MPAPPEMTPTAARLYESLAPLHFAEEEQGFPLAHYCIALARTMDDVADLSRDLDGADTYALSPDGPILWPDGPSLGSDGPSGLRPGWAKVLDVDTAPDGWLPWLGRFVGVEALAFAAAERRAAIRDIRGLRRGTPASLIAAAQALLTGEKWVYLAERQGSAYTVTLTTRESETPEEDWYQPVRNLAVNPSAEVNATNYASAAYSGATVTTGVARVTTDAAGGDACLQATYSLVDNGWGHITYGAAVPRPFPVVPGEFIAARADLKVASGLENVDYIRLDIGFLKGDGTFLTQNSASTVAPTGEWQEVVHNGRLVPANAAYAYIAAIYFGKASGSAVCRMDRLRVGMVSASGEPVGAYIDGDTEGHEWTGTAHASTTQRSLTTQVLDAILPLKPAGLVLTHSIIAGGDFESLRDTHADFTEVAADFADFAAVRDNPATT